MTSPTDLPKNLTGSELEKIEVPPSNDPKIPTWLKLTYITLPIWGVITFFIFWNGSVGWLDRGYWRKLQEAANTTYPFPTAQQEIDKYVPEISKPQN